MLQLESMDRTVSDTMENLETRYRNANPYTRTRIYDRSMGALLLGVNFQCVTYGILLGMAFIYHRRSTEDPRWLRLSVLCACFFCTFCVAISLHGIYWFTIIHYNDPTALQSAPWSVSLLPTFTSAVMLFVRLVFLARVYKLYRAKHQLSRALVAVMAVVALLSVADIGGAAAVTGEFFQKLDFTDVRMLRGIFVGMFSVGIAADALLTALLCIALHKSRSGLRRTDSFINRLIVYTLRTGLVACGCALATLIGFLASSRSLVYAPFYVQIANLYLISLLATLNYRQSVARHMEQPFSLDYGAFDRCGAASLSGQSPSSQLEDGHSSDVRGTLSSMNSRMSIPKSLHMFHLDGRKKSVGSEYGASEKSEVYHHRPSSEVVLDSMVDMQPSPSS